jgi:hypothetical protein
MPVGERICTLLQNLRCPSLTHFRWYKDTFLSRLFMIENPNSSHWKAKFVDGLPHLFAEKIRQALRNKNDGININYPDLTYGQITNTCIQEGLSLCNDIKLKNQLKKQKLTEKHQLGEFCEQFAFDLGKPSSDRQKKKKKISSSNDATHIKRRKHHKSSNKKKRENFSKRKSRENFPSSKNKRKADKFSKDINCHKCGKTGHYANQCWTKKQFYDIEDDHLRS